MPISFRDLSEKEELGLAGYLRFVDEAGGRGVRGALFCIGSRGEPVDFSFCRVDLAVSFLWRDSEARRHAVTALAKALFQATPRVPAALLALADEASPLVFTEDLEVDIPLCRVAGVGTTPQAVAETKESFGDTVSLYWVGTVPAPVSPARRLLEALRDRGLLVEPFERAARGLREVFEKS